MDIIKIYKYIDKYKLYDNNSIFNFLKIFLYNLLSFYTSMKFINYGSHKFVFIDNNHEYVYKICPFFLNKKLILNLKNTVLNILNITYEQLFLHQIFTWYSDELFIFNDLKMNYLLNLIFKLQFNTVFENIFMLNNIIFLIYKQPYVKFSKPNNDLIKLFFNNYGYCSANNICNALKIDNSINIKKIKYLTKPYFSLYFNNFFINKKNKTIILDTIKNHYENLTLLNNNIFIYDCDIVDYI